MSPARRHWIEPPPRDVLDGARRREPVALEAFFDAYFEHVHAFAYRLLGDRTAAQDLTQEVFIKLYRAIDRLEAERDPWPWIATVVQNACRDRWRSTTYRMEKRSDSVDAEPGEAARLVARDGGPEAQLLARERETVVRAAIARLPEKDRQLVLMFNYEGLSHTEVAEMLGVQAAAVRKRYQRAVEALGRIIRETAGW